MRRARPVLLAALVAAPLATGAQAARAAPQYPPSHDDRLRVSATRVGAGEPVTVSGSGFAKDAGANVVVLLTCGARTDVWDTVPVDAQQVATAKIDFPKACRWTVTFVGAGARGEVRAPSAEVGVWSTGTQTGSRPRTAPVSAVTHGPADLTFLWAGLGLVVTSGALIGGLRARRRVRHWT